jgi:hypothetical protein
VRRSGTETVAVITTGHTLGRFSQSRIQGDRTHARAVRPRPSTIAWRQRTASTAAVGSSPGAWAISRATITCRLNDGIVTMTMTASIAATTP